MYVRVCVSTYVHVNVGLCADECVYTSVREWGAHVRGCMCISVCMCMRVRLRQWGCVCEGMCVRVWALIHVRVRARVRAGVRARKYACVIIVLYHYIRAQFVSARVCIGLCTYVHANVHAYLWSGACAYASACV